MCNNETCLGYLLLAIIIAFSFLICFLLKYRKKNLAENLLITSEKIWEIVAQKAAQNGFVKSDLIYGIWQDKTASIIELVVKDSNSDLLTHLEYPMGVRKHKFIIGNEIYLIEFPLTWKRTAFLKKQDGTVLATFTKGAFSIFKHQFVVNSVGVLISKRSKIDLKSSFDYYLQEKLVGSTLSISSKRGIGHIALLPGEFPMPVRLFILSICARGF
jgi:hypothetical protein